MFLQVANTEFMCYQRPGLELNFMLFAQSKKCFSHQNTKSYIKMNMFQAINNALTSVLEKDQTAGKI